VSYIWNKDTIRVSDIVNVLYEQYNKNPTVSIPIADGEREFNYKKDLIPVSCSRCGHSYQITPLLLLSMKEDRGYSCSKCGNLSDAELQKQQRIDMLKIGRQQLIDQGINPDKESEEEREQREQEELEKSMADAMKTDFQNYSTIEDIAPPSPTPPPIAQTYSQESSVSKEKEIQKEQEQAEIVGLEQDEPFGHFFNEEDSKEILEGNKYTDDIYNDIFENDDDETVGEAEESYGEDHVKLDSIVSDNDALDDDSEEVINDEETLSLADSIILDSIVSDNDAIVPLEEGEIDDDHIDYIELDNKKWTKETLNARYKEILLEVKERIGFNPFGDFRYEDGVVSVSCKVCDNNFTVFSLDSLLNETVFLDRETCSKYGLKHKGDAIISACPHCKSSIFKNGYNAFYRKKIETIIKNSNLRIVDPENYWYTSPTESYLLEANGIKKRINYIDLCNKYKKQDMSKHTLFTPRGDATKSEATSVENDKGDAIKGGFSLPKHNPKGQFDFGAVDNSPETLFERQQKQAESQMVFHQNDKIKKQKETIAVLNGRENPFERKEKLDAAFVKTVFYDFVKELARTCNLKFRFEISQKTFEIPIVDFEPYTQGMPGFRLICADYSHDSMCDVPFPIIATTIPFLFNVKTEKGEKAFNYNVLYSDSLQYREQATFNALIKYINPTVLSYGGKRIQLEGNLTVQYTDYDTYLKDFNRDCSPYPDGKPCNGELGILASWVSGNDIDAKDILETLSSLDNKKKEADLNKLKSDYGMYMVCSIKYIEQFNKNIGTMTYTITEYVETSGSMIADGLFQCIRAILKEYYIKYPNLRERSPYIMFEIDPNSYISPSIKFYIARNTILPVDKLYRMQFEGKKVSNIYTSNAVKRHIKYCYMRKNSYRNTDRDNMRRDIRKFNAIGLKKMMSEEIKAAGLQMGIDNDAQRYIFIANMGFVYATQLEIKEYFVHQGIIQRLMLDGNTLLMQKAISPDSIYNSGGIVDSSGDNIQTINNAMYNPFFRTKMDRIMAGKMTPEASDFYRNIMAQKQQSMMQEMWNNNMMNQQVNPTMTEQTMTGGAYMMPPMQGMNYTL
jgi:hypothetical protein